MYGSCHAVMEIYGVLRRPAPRDCQYSVVCCLYWQSKEMMGFSLWTSKAGPLARRGGSGGAREHGLQGWAGSVRTAACAGAGPLTRALWGAAAPRRYPVTRQAPQAGRAVRLPMKYDGLTAKAAGVTCFQTLHLEVIILLDASYNLWCCWLW